LRVVGVFGTVVVVVVVEVDFFGPDCSRSGRTTIANSALSRGTAPLRTGGSGDDGTVVVVVVVVVVSALP
jgi:hypothetical protein